MLYTFTAIPCRGYTDAYYSAAPGHICQVIKTGIITSNVVGWMTAGEATGKFGMLSTKVNEEAGAFCNACKIALEAYQALFKNGNEQQGWALKFGIHDGHMVNRDSGPPITGLVSLEECHRRAKEIRTQWTFGGGKVWFLSAVSPDGTLHNFSELSDPYRS